MNEKILNALGEELSKQVKEKLGDIELAIANDGSYVPADKYEKLKGEYKDLETQSDATNKQIEELKNSSGEVEGLKEKLTTLTTEYDQFKQDSQKREVNFKKTTAYKELLSKNFNPDAVDLLLNTVNLDEINLNEAGKVVDGEVKMQRLAESKPSLKLSNVIEGNKPTDKTTVQEVDTSKMTDDEYFAQQREGE